MQLLLTDVGNATVRKRLLACFEAFGPVVALESAAKAKQQPAVVVGDLHRIVERFPPDAADPLSKLLHCQPVAVGGLVRTMKDQRAISGLHRVARCVEGRVIVKPFTASDDPGRDQEFVGEILERISPDFLSAAQLVPKDAVALRFGDGLSGQVRLSQLKLDRLGRHLVPETVRASCDGDSLQIDDDTGGTIDVDVDVLRRLLDGRHARQLGSEAERVRIEVGKRIRDVRQKHHTTQAVLSTASGIAQEAISRIENGKQSPRADTLQRLAEALNIELHQLLGPS